MGKPRPVQQARPTFLGSVSTGDLVSPSAHSALTLHKPVAGGAMTEVGHLGESCCAGPGSKSQATGDTARAAGRWGEWPVGGARTPCLRPFGVRIPFAARCCGGGEGVTVGCAGRVTPTVAWARMVRMRRADGCCSDGGLQGWRGEGRPAFGLFFITYSGTWRGGFGGSRCSYPSVASARNDADRR